jgi:hypothetical protein
MTVLEDYAQTSAKSTGGILNVTEPVKCCRPAYEWSGDG